jgi:DNA-binding CsgD family transcriptional regulator
VLLGRTRELEAILAACRRAETGHGSVLVVRGEPGIGKSALLAAAATHDGARRVLRATGVEAETAVPLAAVQSLLWPLRSELGELEGTQARLVRALVDLTPQEGTSTFALGAAVLSLLSLVSQREPVLALIDDAHWMDASSQEVFAFVGRRLADEHVVFLVSARTGEESPLAGEPAFTELDLGPLDPESARALVERAAGASLALDVVDRLLVICAGNPLGLVELPRLLDDAQRRGDTPLPETLGAGPGVQRAFAARVAVLDADARAALLLFAAAGEAASVLEVLGAGGAASLAKAERAGLLVGGGSWEFRHPLVRAAVYGAATPDDRRRAHGRIATVLTGTRRAWQLAEAAEAPDERVAAELEAAAEQSRTAGSVIAEAEALERAARLSERPDVRAVRLLGAGRARRRSGRVARSNELLEEALAAASEERTRALVRLERGLNLLRDGARREAYELLVSEAGRLQETDPIVAARLFAALTLVANVDVGGPSALAFAERALALVSGADGDVELEVLFSAVSARMSRPMPPDDDDRRLVGRAAALLERRDLRVGEQPHWIAYALAELERDADARELSDLALAEARATGDVWSLCYGLYARAVIELALGRLDTARAWSSEAIPLAEQIGEQWRSEQATAIDAEVTAALGVEPHKDAGALLHGRWALAAEEPVDAAVWLEEAVRALAVETPRAWFRLAPLDLAEAYAASDRPNDAAAVLANTAPGIERSGLIRPRAKLARVRALLGPESEIDAAFAAARSLLDDAPHPQEAARIELAWGERLAGAGRSADATPHLERAVTAFDAFGATGWSSRARGAVERVTGAARPMRRLRTGALTAQELRVARHAAAGARDREIAALLYLSPRTVESYLQSAYRKLEVSNRTQLAGVLASEGIAALEVP